MRHRSTWPILALITALTAFSVLVVWPGYPKMYLPDFIDYPEGPIIDVGDDAMRLGLDLSGGTYLLTEANLAALPPGRDPDQAMEAVKKLLEDRVNEFGVSETEVTREGRNRIAIQIPGIPPEEARDLIGRTALLNFREPVIDDAGNMTCETVDGVKFGVAASSTAVVFDDEGNQSLGCTGVQGEIGNVVWKAATGTTQGGETRALTGAHVRNAEYSLDSTGLDVVLLALDGEGARLMEEISGRLVNYPLGIFLDDELLSAPNVNTQLSGDIQISGLERDEAKNLAKLIEGGALPVPLTTIQATEVDATLGERTLVRGVQAGLIGIMAVMFFMIVYYRVPGLLASMALFTYIVVLMMIFKLGPVIGPVTITLAGIAGFVLSVGMAVDANILVFERLKEELRGGRSLPAAIEHGFDRAWSSIRDSNVSTLITCAILFWFGDQFNAQLVKGFALTLGIGVLVSMFSAIVVTRTLLRALVGTPLGRRLWLFAPDLRPMTAAQRARPFAFDFVKKRGFYFLLSAALLIPGLISLAAPPHLKTGIEFSSGATFTIDFVNDAITQDQVRDALAEIGHDEARVQKTEEGRFIIRTEELNVEAGPPLGPTPPSERDELEDGLRAQLGDFNTLNFNQVSEIVSSEIATDAAIAVLFAATAILVYITWSFRNVPKSYRYGVAAVVAAMHDALFVLGAFALFGHVFGTEIDSLFITGILTVIGFSVHDTIVVFDRIRENVATNPGVPFDEVVNASLTETVARSINTSATVVFTLVSMLLLGAGDVNILLLTLLLGIIAGTYSSIFIASQILVSWEDGDFARLFSWVPRRRAETAAEAGAT